MTPKPLTLHNSTDYPTSNSWEVFPETGATLDDVLEPTWWGHVVSRLKAGDYVTVRPVDFAFWAHLLVVSTTPTTATVVVLQSKDIGKVEPSTSALSGYSVGYGGPHHKWRIMHGSEVYEKGFESEQAAMKRLASLVPAAA